MMATFFWVCLAWVRFQDKTPHEVKDGIYEITNTSLKTKIPYKPQTNDNDVIDDTIARKCISIIIHQTTVDHSKYLIHRLLVEIGAMLGKDTFPGFNGFDDYWKAVEKDVKAATKTTMLAFIQLKDKKNFKSRCRNAFKLVDLLAPGILFSPPLVRDGRGSMYSRLTNPGLSEIVHILYSSTLDGTNIEDSLLWWWKKNDRVIISDEVSKNTSRLTALIGGLSLAVNHVHPLIVVSKADSRHPPGIRH
ncbi:hypothetical protein DFS34DRAFT_67477 [Phlyctochytrium arcticum]|nr:hypothetical protein DFS34DRAFT_67477 [Phlyctochytrium arcticum]